MSGIQVSFLRVHAAPAESLVSRAFAGVTPRVVGYVLAVAVAYALTRAVSHVLVAIVDDQLSDWFQFAFRKIVVNVLIAAILFCAVVVTGNLGPQRGWQRVAALSAAVVGATLCASVVRIPLGIWAWPTGTQEPTYLEVLWHQGTSYAFLTGMLMLVAAFVNRERANLASAHQADLDRNELERQMVQARIQVLQAQIEPHFLFNTLANVRRLYETDREAGHRMLDNLMRYFEAVLPQMRAATTTLEGELALIESYLNVQQIRIGRRLGFSIDVPDALKRLEVPPMMLLTLVENALKHGIAPLPEGGAVRIVARVEDDRLVLAVIDTGRGLSGTGGAGTGLANIRARLHAAYGADADLSIRGNTPRGIVAALRIPLARRTSDSGSAIGPLR